jgi:hypothetical protein
MEKEPGPLSPEEIKAIAERRAASLKRVQEMHKKSNTEGIDKSSKRLKPPPPKGRNFRHQGR